MNEHEAKRQDYLEMETIKKLFPRASQIDKTWLEDMLLVTVYGTRDRINFTVSAKTIKASSLAEAVDCAVKSSSYCAPAGLYELGYTGPAGQFGVDRAKPVDFRNPTIKGPYFNYQDVMNPWAWMGGPAPTEAVAYLLHGVLRLTNTLNLLKPGMTKGDLEMELRRQ